MMKKHTFLLVFGFFASTLVFANELITKSPENARVYFISPTDGETVSGEVTVQFGLSGMGVPPAGSNVKNTGHHHILINKDVSEIDVSSPLPATDQVKHFGGGQTETVLKLPKGKHTLQLLLGNYAHIRHDKPVISEKITVTVK
ncbi:MAG TPA: rod shape-determining protein RodA [Gammaproteobacteria bacterium]|nr:rod shape-determining protein RodA [Gammaproteobacteria bacterium]